MKIVKFVCDDRKNKLDEKQSDIDCSFNSKSLMYWYPQSDAGCELLWWFQFIYYPENWKDLILFWEGDSEWNRFWVIRVVFGWREESFLEIMVVQQLIIITLLCINLSINQLTWGLLEEAVITGMTCQSLLDLIWLFCDLNLFLK